MQVVNNILLNKLLNKKIFIILVSLIVITISLIIISYIFRRNLYVKPQKSDFVLDIVYQEKSGSVVAKLHNISDNDYNIFANGLNEDFIQLHIKCDSDEYPINKLLVISKIPFENNSSINREISLKEYNISGNCEIYAKAEFYITNPYTSEKYLFEIQSKTIKLD